MYEGRSKSFATQYDAQMSNTSKIFMLLFNIITLSTNAYVTFIKKLFDASQIELWWPAVQIRLSTQWPAWSHCHRGTTSSDDEIDGWHWVLGLLSRVGVTTIPIQCSLLQPAEQEQGSKMTTRSNRPLGRTCWRACNKNSIWLASKSCLINVTYALVLRVIMLNNNIKILLVSFVHHTELQNFLNVPRIKHYWDEVAFYVLMCHYESTYSLVAFSY